MHWRRGFGMLARARGEARSPNSAVGLAEQIGHPLFAAFPAMDIAWIRLRNGRRPGARSSGGKCASRSPRRALGSWGSDSVSWTTDIEALIASGHLDEAQIRPRQNCSATRDRRKMPNAITIRRRLYGSCWGRAQISPRRSTRWGWHDRARPRPLAPEIARTLLELGTLQRRAKQKRAAKQTPRSGARDADPDGCPDLAGARPG